MADVKVYAANNRDEHTSILSVTAEDLDKIIRAKIQSALKYNHHLGQDVVSDFNNLTALLAPERREARERMIERENQERKAAKRVLED